jgi:ADP-ribosylation factor-like protein 8
MFSQLWQSILEWLQSIFFQQEMELTVLGLQNAGKTTLVNLLSTGDFTDDRIPTVGFNVRRVQKGGVTLKIWDLGGHARFRTMWERYCRGVSAIVFVVDAADEPRFETARVELHDILARPVTAGIPVLVLANKSDLPGAVKSTEDIIDILALRDLPDPEPTPSSSTAAALPPATASASPSPPTAGGGVSSTPLGHPTSDQPPASQQQVHDHRDVDSPATPAAQPPQEPAAEQQKEPRKKREVACYSISAKNKTNIDVTLQWLIAHASK